MALNPKFIAARDLQEYLVDKTTGLPLTNGTLTFYSDTNRTELKNVYQLSGYPNYTYEPLPNPLSLSGVGTTVNESGQYVPIYYWPYLGDPSVDSNTVERYYITVDSVNPIINQYNLEAWPPGIFNTSGDNVGEDVFNYIPNGQFLAHNDINHDPNSNLQPGQITQPITVIAPGGWTFERPTNSTATDIVTFFRYGAYVSDPTSSPRYAVSIACNGANPSDAFKYLGCKFYDVNKFASNQIYTFNFNSELGASSSFDVQLLIIKNFGTGGAASPTQITLVDTFTIIPGVQYYSSSFSFGNNTGDGIGTNNDDYVQLVLAFPTNQTYVSLFTDFSLVFGNIVLSGFPIQTNADMMARTMTLPPPDPDGMDLYLPIMATREGLTYDDSQIGKVYMSASNILSIGELPCDGTMLETAGYSSDGIPYSRLFNKIVSGENSALTWFGPPKQYVAMYVTQALTDNKILLTTNQPGGQTITTDGANPTGFTFTTPSVGQSTLGFSAYYSTSATDGSQTTLWCVNNSVGAVSGNSNAGNSGLSVTISRGGQDQAGFGEEGYLGGIKQIVRLAITTIPVSGHYFNMATPSQQYYFWFRVDGVGSDPAQPGIGVRIDLLSTMTTTTVTRCIVSALNAWQTTTIYTVAGGSLPNSSYFNFYSNGQHYYPWFSLNGTGIDPSLSNAIGIPVIYLSSDSDIDIGIKLLDAVNTKYYATPDLRGLFIRGVDGGSGVDPDLFLRYSLNAADVEFQGLGTLEFDEILSHQHLLSIIGNNNIGSVYAQLASNNATPSVTTPTQFTGGDESRPINMALNYVIKY